MPDFTTPAVFTTEEPCFLQRCGSPQPFISLASPVFSQDLPSPDVASDELLKQLGFRVLKGVVTKEEASQSYAIGRASLDSTGSQQEEVWDLISNKDSREACLAVPTLPCRCQTRPGNWPTVLDRDPLKRANELFTARWPPTKDLHPTQSSSLATGEDGGQQDWHVDVDYGLVRCLAGQKGKGSPGGQDRVACTATEDVTLRMASVVAFCMLKEP